MKYLICGNYGAGNIGDELILDGLLNFIKRNDPKAQITAISAKPQKQQIKAVKPFPAGIRSLFQSTKETKDALKECHYFILGGGGLFGSLTLRANLIWGIQAWQAYRKHKPVLMLGQSIGELKGPIRKFIVKKLFQKAKLIVLRDQKSIERLKSLGIKQKIYLAADFALKNRQQSQKEKLALICLRQISNLPQNFIPEINKFITQLKKDHWQVLYVNFQEPDDQTLHKQIDAEKGHYSDFKTASFVLAMRLHSIISAINYKIPFLAINYAPKVRDFLQTTHLAEHISNTADLSANFQKLRAKIPNPSFPAQSQSHYLDQAALDHIFQSTLNSSQD